MADEEKEERIIIIKEEQEEEEEMSTTTNLPQEVLMEILSRLPAKSLVTIFKLVCKGWCNLIQDPDFVKMHLNRVASSIHGDRDGGRRSLIRKPKYVKALFQLHPPPPPPPPPPLNCDQPPLIFNDLPISVATKLDFDFDLLPPSKSIDLDVVYDLSSSSSSSSSTRLVGSWNGLLCLSINDDKRIVLLNPSTRKYKVSPRELIQCQFTFLNNDVTYGFGCCHNSTTTTMEDDEYKVVRIAYFNHPPQIDIYSMSSNSWRTVKDIPPRRYFGHQSSGIFLNGVVHWMGCNHGYPYIWDTIVCFNIRDEVFGQLPMAPCVDVVVVHNSHDVILMNWRGYLGMIYCSRTQRMDIDLEIWVMKEYGIGESWTKEFVIRTSDSDPLGELPAGFSIGSRGIMTYFWTGDQILIQGKYTLVTHHVGSLFHEWRIYARLVLYDMNKKKINEDVLMVDIPYEPRDEQVDYIDTLVSLKSSLLPLSNNRKRKN